MKIITILICKTGIFILNFLGKGTSFPGSLALKLKKNILTDFKIPERTICITGTTGKTSISGTLTSMLENLGYKVANNSKGSNLKPGVVSCLIKNSTITGKIKADVLILEIDERYIKKVFPELKPNYFIINNLSRDQLARNGHHEIVWDEINSQIDPHMNLILNADDPLISSFALNKKNKVTYFGIKKTSNSYKEQIGNTLDQLYCPVCHSKLKFSYFHYGNLGNYSCPKCEFKRPIPNYEAEVISDNKFLVEDNEIKVGSSALYVIYNTLASYSCLRSMGINKNELVKSLDNIKLKVKRMDEFKLNGNLGVLLLSKNETPISYNSSIDYIIKQNSKKTVVMGFNRLSGRYDLKDFSWMYDIHFEQLNADKNIQRIICVGPFAEQIVTRLKYASIDLNIVKIVKDTDSLLSFLKENSVGDIYCMLYFDVEKALKKQLKQEGLYED